MVVDYTKPPLTYEQQVALLQSRGLIVNNVAETIKFLQQVSYYRFSAYCIPFQKPRDVFLPGITFEKIVELYRLDEELRISLMALLSPIEVFLRSRTIYELSRTWGAYAHCNSAIFFNKEKHSKWLTDLEEDTQKSKEKFLEHYKEKYNGFPRLPIWMACEIMSFGCLSDLYGNLSSVAQSQISSIMGVRDNVFKSWFHVITYLRNISAHHGRLWNLELAIRPLIPDKDKQWLALNLNNTHLFPSIVIAEWICHKANLPICAIEPVYETMRKIAALDTRFATMMGVPAGRNIGMCWENLK